MRPWESVDTLQCYMLESDWHALRFQHHLTAYGDAIFCTDSKFPFFDLIRHRPWLLFMTRLPDMPCQSPPRRDIWPVGESHFWQMRPHLSAAQPVDRGPTVGLIEVWQF